MHRFLCFAVILPFLTFPSCAARETLDFHVDEDLVLKAEVGLENFNSRSKYTFDLERPILVQSSGGALILEFLPGAGKIDLAIGTAESVVIEEVLDSGFAMRTLGTPSAERITFSVPLPAGTTFDRFTLLHPVADEDDADMLPVYAGLGAAAEGIFSGPAPLLDTRIAIETSVSNPHVSTVYDISGITQSLIGIAGIRLGYSYEPAGGDPCTVTLVAGGVAGAARFDVTLRRGNASVYLYEGMCGFVPMTLEVLVEGTGFSVTSLKIDELFRGTGAGLQPMPVDLGGLLVYARDQWRNEEFELFSWNLRPEVLLIDTASYPVQSGFFKRLAFFVEKSGSAGSLLPDEMIADKHGWNAHDYQASDLALFFNKAQSEGFQLGERELLLRQILADRGIIRRSGGEWDAGVGAVLSVSQESVLWLRALFLQHEGYHGFFFTDAGYRDVCFAVWNGLSPLEQQFWREFLYLRNYNVYDEFLVVNEFQAFLMQVKRENLDAYYWDYSVPALVTAAPETAALVEELKAAFPDTFRRSAAPLENYLLERVGAGAADLFCLRRTGG